MVNVLSAVLIMVNEYMKNIKGDENKYKKLETRRSRVVCLNITNNRKYTINRAVKIQRIENGFFI